MEQLNLDVINKRKLLAPLVYPYCNLYRDYSLVRQGDKRVYLPNLRYEQRN